MDRIHVMRGVGKKYDTQATVNYAGKYVNIPHEHPFELIKKIDQLE